jgi:hypothetical protein
MSMVALTGYVFTNSAMYSFFRNFCVCAALQSTVKFTTICEENTPLRQVVSFIGCPCCALGCFLQKILNLLVGHTESFVRNSGHFTEIVSKFKVTFDIVSIFTDVPISEALEIIRNKVSLDYTFIN